MDSVVLLTLLVTLRQTLGFELKAMHVHHGLSPHADTWTDFCMTLCRSLDVELQVVRVTIPRKSAAGTEATARAARYQALLGAPADFVVLAHHQDDQAETLLLQLTRGAGVRGLSAMAKVDRRRRLLRPLLEVGRDEIRAYASQHGLQWVEDESNQDVRYDRNHIRQHTLPALEIRFPGVRRVIARSASHIAEASELLNDLALLDAQRCMRHQQLVVSELRSLSEARARNLLRWWLAGQDIVLPSTARLQEMLQQLLDARPDAQVKMAIGPQGTCLRRYQDMVYLDQEQPIEPFSLTWKGEDSLKLPDGSILRFLLGYGHGLAYQRLGIDRLRVAQRSGGERFKPDLGRPSRTLKHLLQEANMPPWQRQRLPLIYHEDSLALVPGIGVAADLQAAEHEPALDITWQQAPD
jgi:tRNA(Ile)-lysidine synthase